MPLRQGWGGACWEERVKRTVPITHTGGDRSGKIEVVRKGGEGRVFRAGASKNRPHLLKKGVIIHVPI